jgi:hypothetical protein
LTHAKAESPETVDVSTCSLDEPDAVPPATHTWVKYRLTWERTAGRLPECPEAGANSTGGCNSF